jgi:hypothetical protein
LEKQLKKEKPFTICIFNPHCYSLADLTGPAELKAIYLSPAKWHFSFSAFLFGLASTQPYPVRKEGAYGGINLK